MQKKSSSPQKAVSFNTQAKKPAHEWEGTKLNRREPRQRWEMAHNALPRGRPAKPCPKADWPHHILGNRIPLSKPNTMA